MQTLSTLLSLIICVLGRRCGGKGGKRERNEETSFSLNSSLFFISFIYSILVFVYLLLLKSLKTNLNKEIQSNRDHNLKTNCYIT